MKKYLLVLLAIALFTTAGFAQQKTGTTTISLTVGPEAWISVPSSTPLLNAGSDFTVDYVGTTAIAYKVRTTTSGSITFKAAEFDVTGGPKIASPVAGDELKYTSIVGGTSVGTGVTTAANVTSTSTDYPVVTFGANASSKKAGDGTTVNWTLPNDPQYKTGAYSSIVTFTISAT
jgi:hypothetical protein